MAEIILSFFAVIGFVVFAMQLCDYFFYRRFRGEMVLTVDLREMDEKTVVDCFELIATVRQSSLGKAAIGSLLVLDDHTCLQKRSIAVHYMNFFHIPGEIKPYDPSS